MHTQIHTLKTLRYTQIHEYSDTLTHTHTQKHAHALKTHTHTQA